MLIGKQDFFTGGTSRGPGAAAVQAALLLLLGVALWIAYRPGLSGPYVFDDFQNISRNSGVAIDNLSWTSLLGAAFSKAEAGLGRPLAMVTFGLNYYFAGQSFEPFHFKLTNLAIHAANVLLVFFLARSLFRLLPADEGPGRGFGDRRAVIAAFAAAALWGLHPLQLTSVVYTVQRMTTMSAFFVLAGMLVFVHGRRMFADLPWRGVGIMAGGLAGGVGLGVLCKENAVLLPPLAALVELTFFNRASLSAGGRRLLSVFYLCFVGIPVLAGTLYVLFNPEFILAGYATRSFDLTERLLTESRVLFFYLSLIVFPLIGRFGLHHDDFALSTGLLQPPTTLLALAAWVVIAAAMLRGLLRRKLWAFALAWFLFAHAIESSFLALELIHEHRNYLPTIGIFIVAARYLMIMLDGEVLRPRVLTAIGLCVILVLGFVTHTRAQAWGSRSLLFETLVRHHPTSYRALTGLAAGMRDEQRDARAVYKVLRDAALASPTTVHPLIEMAKMLQALMSVSDRAESAAPAQLSKVSGEPWAADPVLNGPYLLQVDQALSEEISRRILSGRIHMETVYALWTAQSCVLNGRAHCTPLTDRLLDWHHKALETLPPSSRRRAMLELSTAKLYAVRSQIPEALEYVDKAIETASGEPRYRAQKALLLIKLGNIEEARRITDEIARHDDWKKRYVRDVEVLRQAIADATSEAAASSRQN